MKCLNPLFSSIQHAYVPCGQCYYCRQRIRYQWTCRVLMERLTYSNGYFITLTYDNDHLPQDKGVSKKDCKYFVDEFRKLFISSSFEFSYYLMSEYGGRNRRPHYHMHLFTDAPKSFVLLCLEKLWNHGFTKVGSTTVKSVLYTSAFHLLPKEHKEQYPKPNFHMMTRGLGKRFVEKWKDYYLANERRVFEFGGFRFNLPPYIRDKFGLPHDSDVHSLELFTVKNDFYLGRIMEGQTSKIYIQWDQYCNFLNNRLIEKGLKYKI